MTTFRLLPTVLLGLFALVSGWLLWHWRDQEQPAALVGPPRSDYRLENFEMIALDDAGLEAFSARGPRLDRHPELGTLDIDQPQFVFPNQEGERWSSHARRAWISRDGQQLQLLGDVLIEGPEHAGSEPLRLRSERIDVYPKENRAESSHAVTVTEPGSILRALGMRADFNAHQIELLSEVRIHHEVNQHEAKH